MKDDKLSVQSMDFAVSIIELVKSLKEKRESIISNQIGRSGTSVNFLYKYIKARLNFSLAFSLRVAMLFHRKCIFLLIKFGAYAIIILRAIAQLRSNEIL